MDSLVVIRKMGLAMTIVHTTFTHYEDTKGNANVEIRVAWVFKGHPRSLAT